MHFADRRDGGRRLARQLLPFLSEQPLILALPRGGVPVAWEIAQALGTGLDIWVVKKVGSPHYPELGLGAVAEGGVVYLNKDMIRAVGASDDQVEAAVARKSQELRERVRQLRGNLPAPRLKDRSVILVDDGIATGGTVRAALQALGAAGAARVILATPIASTQALQELETLVDHIVCLHSTSELSAIGAWYDDFHQLTDQEVISILNRARGEESAPSWEDRKTGLICEDLLLDTAEGPIAVRYAGPRQAIGLVVFAHGQGSHKHSPRNRHLASVLQRYGLATLLFDLLDHDEESILEISACLDLMVRRLQGVTQAVRVLPRTRGCVLGYFGSGTGGAAALQAAAQSPEEVAAVVIRGGRVDLVPHALARVRASTLLVVGELDSQVLRANQQAYRLMTAPRKLTVIPKATHLFEEPGALDAVARVAGEWFRDHLKLRQPLSAGLS